MRLVLLGVLVLSARAEPTSRAEPFEEAAKAIAVANARFALANLRGDGETLGALYTNDAVLLQPGYPILRGRKAIDDFWKDGGFLDSKRVRKISPPRRR